MKYLFNIVLMTIVSVIIILKGLIWNFKFYLVLYGIDRRPIVEEKVTLKTVWTKYYLTK